MRLWRLHIDSNQDLRERVVRKSRHVDALVDLHMAGVRRETFESMHSRGDVGGTIHFQGPDSSEMGQGQPIYKNHASALVHWHLPVSGSSDWMVIEDACIVYTLLRGSVTLHSLDASITIEIGQSVRIPAGTKFRFAWEGEVYAAVLYQRRDVCPCGETCSVVKTGPDLSV